VALLATGWLQLLAAGGAWGQHYHLRHYTVDDGLPSSHVRDLIQDGRGRMWFATRSGVARYDGREWRSYSLAEGLSWADQFALREDPAGDLWSVSSLAPFRIYRFDGEGWSEAASSEELGHEGRISGFELLPGVDGAAFAVGTSDRGLLIYRAGRWRRLDRSQGLPADEVSALAVAGHRLLIGTAGGLAELRNGRPVPLLEGRTPSPRICALAPEGGGDVLWVIGDRWIGRLEGEVFTLLEEAEAGAPFSRPPWSAHRMAVADGQGGVYFAGPSDLRYYNPRYGFERIGRRHGLLEEGATALFLDREENLWVAGELGVTKIINRRFASYTREHGLYDGEVTAVLERRSGTIVLGHRGGLTFLDGGEVRSTLELTGGGAPAAGSVGRSPERVRDLAEDAGGDLWIAVDSRGLARLPAGSPPAGSPRWFGAAEGLAGAVTSVLFDEVGELWAATDEGLFRYRGAAFERLSPESVRIHVRRLFAGMPGEVLMATDQGLYRYSAEGWRIWRCGEEGAACNSVFAALPTGDGELWVGTGTGLYRTVGEELRREAGLEVERPVFFLLRDRSDRIWLGTDNGVVRWQGGSSEHFTVADGLAGRETQRAGAVVDSRGDVWIGTERGVTVYTERRPAPRRPPPKVALTGVEVSGRPTPVGEDRRLDPWDDDLTFYFEVLSFVDEERIQIRHRLEGWDSDWVELRGDSRHVAYANLRPGSYRFRVQAANARGRWSRSVDSATFRLSRPFWQRPWFFVVLAAVFGGVVYTFQRLRVQSRHSRRLEAEVAARVAELRASEESYRHIFERSQAVKLLIDADTLEILDANRAACRFYGRRREELEGRSLEDLRVPEEVGTTLPRTTESSTHLLAERHQLAGGQVRDVEIYVSPSEMRGRPIFYVIVHDVTERRLAEETMSTEKERLAATLRNIDDGVITTGPAGRILLLNRKAEEITGRSGAEAIGRPLKEVLRLYEPGEEGEPGARLELPGNGDLFEPIELAVLETRSGEHKLVELSGSPIRRADGELAGRVLAFRDVTEKRKLERELTRTQKLEALGILAGGIAHDFNNLLTVLLGNLSLLDVACELSADATKHLKDAQAAVLRARDLTRQLLTFSRGGTPVRKAASIREVIEESASFVLSGSKVRCEVELPEALWMVEIDAGQMSQVINNLLINAIQAMPEGGTVRIVGENRERPPRALPPGRYVAIRVIDQGVGIAPENLGRIFDPYFSTKDAGRGLGLASAYSIAKQHDGLLTVASRPGRGTTFTLYLPASRSRALFGEEAPEEVGSRSGRLLVMDDDEGVRAVTGAMAERLGYRVELASEGGEAIELYRRGLGEARPFDAVIMDLTIRGGMGGREAIRRLVELDPEVRAVVVSGYSNDPVLANYRDYGFLGRIGKPFRPEDLAQVLDDVLGTSEPAEVRAGEGSGG
jgi:PAS domain S-box-containing protein